MTLPIFNIDSMTIGEKTEHLERLLKAKCRMYSITLGIHQGVVGPSYYNILATVKTNTKQNVVLTKSAESFNQMLTLIIDDLQRL